VRQVEDIRRHLRGKEKEKAEGGGVAIKDWGAGCITGKEKPSFSEDKRKKEST